MKLSVYSTSRDQRIRDLVDKDIITIDESALISDSVRIMKIKAYHPYLLRDQVIKMQVVEIFRLALYRTRHIVQSHYRK